MVLINARVILVLDSSKVQLSVGLVYELRFAAALAPQQQQFEIST